MLFARFGRFISTLSNIDFSDFNVTLSFLSKEMFIFFPGLSKMKSLGSKVTVLIKTFVGGLQ